MKVAIIVIDMLNDFVEDRGVLKCDRAKRIIPNIKRLVDLSRRKKLPIIYANDAHASFDRELELWGPHAIAGTWGSRVINELKPRKGDLVVEKRRYSAFYGTALDLLLRELEVDTVILTGIHAHICVQHTAADAYFRAYKVIVPVDCVEATTEDARMGAIDFMKKVYAVEVVKLDELIKRFSEV
mgnify:CR=1 FL=1